ncbi:MAG TPA: glycoside hydrolase family 3 N-terminal domain-containing protein [Acidobacteriaceae bacterium]|jgi:beta-glucosidase|nr:glycoside hydrolase family 3 N-terminal domain-containing protein [Acidobacteriaceae bacterium]
MFAMLFAPTVDTKRLDRPSGKVSCHQPSVRTSCGAILCLLVALAAPAASPQATSNPQLADKALNDRVNALLARMTLQEKIGQLSQYSGGFETGPDAGNLNVTELITRGEVGSLLNAVGAETANRYQHIAVDHSRLHIPLLLGDDVIHGDRTLFPVPLGLAASFDPALVAATARMAATEARADGIDWVFSPMVDIARDARWGRIVEGSGSDPFLGSAMARAYVEGYQKNDLSRADSVAASVKHYAAYGAPIAGRDYNAVDMSELTLRQVYLPPYHAAVDAGVATVMSAFNSLNGVPESANPFTLTQVLRREWGFDGFVVTDWRAVAELLNHGVALDPAAASRMALTAGADMDMLSDFYRTQLPGLVRSGQVPESVVDEAVRRVLRVKFALGLFDHPYAPASPPYTAGPLQRGLARHAAEESIVLLKNDGKLLPLRPSAKIALIGPLADSQRDMLGSWTSQGNPADAVTLRAALEQRLPHDALQYVQGTEVQGDSDAGFPAAVAAARQADVVLLALGESGSMTGEATSRAHLGLPGNQEQLLEAVAATGKPVILILFNGHPLATPWAAAHVPAILEAWFPGIEAGPALSSILFGETNPSGHLPVDLPRSVGQEPLYYAQTATGRPAIGTDLSHPPANDAEKYVSRYLDEPNSPQFPFGWGLSYTTFAYSAPRLSTERVPLAQSVASNPAPLVTVSVDIQNSGSVAGADVVQLYLRNRGASVEQPVQQLEGFQRVLLRPGESKTLEFTLTFPQLAFYNAQLQRVVEPTDYTVFVGDNSQAAASAAFQVR